MLQAHAGSAKAAIGQLLNAVAKSKVKNFELLFIDALTKHMAVEWGENKVRVVGVSPGPIAETEGMRKLGLIKFHIPQSCTLHIFSVCFYLSITDQAERSELQKKSEK